MKLIHSFLAEIDEKWKPVGGEPIRLQIIGLAALMLQTDYERGTKDSDVLEAKEITPSVRKQLIVLAGPESPSARERASVESCMRAVGSKNFRIPHRSDCRL